jgi:hypothetical protein
MKKISSILAAGLLVLITSCDPAKQFEKEITTIDSTLNEIDSLESIFDGIDFDSLRYMKKHVIQNEDLIAKYYTPGDTLDQLLGKYMNDCKSVRKKLGSLDQDEVYFGDEFNLLKHQFTDLKEDILAGVYKDEQVKLYLNTEMEAFKTVALSFEGFVELIKVEKNRFYVASPKIDAFVSTLNITEELE